MIDSNYDKLLSFSLPAFHFEHDPKKIQLKGNISTTHPFLSKLNLTLSLSTNNFINKINQKLKYYRRNISSSFPENWNFEWNQIYKLQIYDRSFRIV